MRKLRELKSGARYHVSARANRRESVLDSSEIKELFLAVLREAKMKYDFKIEHFCIMGNHYHLIIKPGENECLSVIMKWIMQVFAIRYNRRLGICGHVWGDRFYSRILVDREDFKRIFEYINSNPVKEHFVSDPGSWPYGGLCHHREGRFDILDLLPAWIAELFEAARLAYSVP